MEPDLETWAAQAAAEESPEVRRRMADLAAGAGREAAVGGDPDTGLRWMRAASELDPEREDLRCALAAMEALGLPPEQVPAWGEQLLERWPGQAIALVHASVALHKGGRGLEALQLLLGVLARAPTLDARSWRAVGGGLLGLGRAAAAEEALVRAQRQDPDNAALWLELAVTSLQLGRDRQAAERLQRAGALDPEVEGLAGLQRSLEQSAGSD